LVTATTIASVATIIAVTVASVVSIASIAAPALAVASAVILLRQAGGLGGDRCDGVRGEGGCRCAVDGKGIKGIVVERDFDCGRNGR
jgi:hypothetical protein